MIDQSFVIKILDTKEMMGVHELTTSKVSTLDCEILQKVGRGKEDGEVSPFISTLMTKRVLPHHHETSTQKSETKFRSGGVMIFSYQLFI